MATVLDLAAIKDLLDTSRLIDEIEAGFVMYSQGKVRVPPVGFLHIEDPPGDVHIKYGFVPGAEHYVLKVASGFYENPALGLPPSDGVILVFSQKTGALELVLHDRCWLTDMRTAAAGAVAARHLAPTDIDHIGIVGSGVQARMQLRMLRHVVDCNRCLVWGRNPSRVDAMIEELRVDTEIRAWGLQVEAAPTLDELMDRSRLVVTTTSARSPLIRVDQVRPGTHITAMGSDDDGKQELEAGVLERADLVVADSLTQCCDHGECAHAIAAGLLSESQVVELGTVVSRPELGRTDARQVSVADLTGVAIQDIQIATMIEQSRRV